MVFVCNTIFFLTALNIMLVMQDVIFQNQRKFFQTGKKQTNKKTTTQQFIEPLTLNNFRTGSWLFDTSSLKIRYKFQAIIFFFYSVFHLGSLVTCWEKCKFL